MSIAHEKSKQLNIEMTARSIEKELECKRRIKETLEKMKEDNLDHINIQEAYDVIVKGKGKL